jgi:hypothetical protein
LRYISVVSVEQLELAAHQKILFPVLAFFLGVTPTQSRKLIIKLNQDTIFICANLDKNIGAGSGWGHDDVGSLY